MRARKPAISRPSLGISAGILPFLSRKWVRLDMNILLGLMSDSSANVTRYHKKPRNPSNGFQKSVSKRSTINRVLSILWIVTRNFAAGGCKIFFFRRSGIFIRNKPVNPYRYTYHQPTMSVAQVANHDRVLHYGIRSDLRP
jgi:hypothetical protein